MNSVEYVEIYENNSDKVINLKTININNEKQMKSEFRVIKSQLKL